LPFKRKVERAFLLAYKVKYNYSVLFKMRGQQLF